MSESKKKKEEREVAEPVSGPDFLAEASRIYLLPNFFTAGNLFFGFVAIIRCIQAKYAVETPEMSQAYYMQAVYCILLAFICDALDGRVARLGGRESLFGKEFDSIADVVSFGVAPALMVFFLILSPTDDYPFFQRVGWLIGFTYLLCAGVRLARFNVITHPMLLEKSGVVAEKDFVGLPVPAAAGLIASLSQVLIHYELDEWSILLPILMLLIAWLMVSSITYPSFKQIDWSTQTRTSHFIFLVVLLVVGAMFIRQFLPAALFLGYIFFGLFREIQNKLLKKSG